MNTLITGANQGIRKQASRLLLDDNFRPELIANLGELSPVEIWNVIETAVNGSHFLWCKFEDLPCFPELIQCEIVVSGRFFFHCILKELKDRRIDTWNSPIIAGDAPFDNFSDAIHAQVDFFFRHGHNLLLQKHNKKLMRENSIP